MALKMLFEKTGKCSVTSKVNGLEAFNVVSSCLNQEPKVFYDLVLLDLNMPVMDGFEASQKINELYSREPQFSCNISRLNNLPLVIASSA